MSRLIDQKGLKIFSTEMQMTMFSEFTGLERGLVVHLGIGIHVADVAVADQVHVTKLFFNSTNVVVYHVASRVSI